MAIKSMSEKPKSAQPVSEQPTYETVTYATPSAGVAQITMNRPEMRNAQDLQMTYDLNDAFERAAADAAIKVIILAGADPHFSAGHDLSGKSSKTWEDFSQVTTWGSFDPPGAEGRYARESEIYLGMTERWRNVPKPTIAAVQGKCIAGGLMLAWACDIIIASDDAEFRDPVVEMGVCGVEFFAHPWEMGPRKAKELLFTADWLGLKRPSSWAWSIRWCPVSSCWTPLWPWPNGSPKSRSSRSNLPRKRSIRPRMPWAVPPPWPGCLPSISFVTATICRSMAFPWIQAGCPKACVAAS